MSLLSRFSMTPLVLAGSTTLLACSGIKDRKEEALDHIHETVQAATAVLDKGAARFESEIHCWRGSDLYQEQGCDGVRDTNYNGLFDRLDQWAYICSIKTGTVQVPGPSPETPYWQTYLRYGCSFEEDIQADIGALRTFGLDSNDFGRPFSELDQEVKNYLSSSNK